MDYEEITQIGEVFITVLPPSPKSPANETRATIITYNPEPENAFEEYILQGVWHEHLKLTGSVDEVVEQAKKVASMFFNTQLLVPVDIYWQNSEDADIKTYNTNAQTVFEFAIAVNEEERATNE